MNWKIKKIKQSMKIEFQSGNLTLDAFMNRGFYDFPRLLENISNGTGIHFEYESIETPADLDDHDVEVLGISIPEGQLRIGNRLEEEYTFVSEREFNQMLLDFSSKLLKIHQKDDKMEQTWKEEMENGIRKLKEKISNS
jgi:hypothetical protein